MKTIIFILLLLGHVLANVKEEYDVFATDRKISRFCLDCQTSFRLYRLKMLNMTMPEFNKGCLYKDHFIIKQCSDLLGLTDVSIGVSKFIYLNKFGTQNSDKQYEEGLQSVNHSGIQFEYYKVTQTSLTKPSRGNLHLTYNTSNIFYPSGTIDETNFTALCAKLEMIPGKSLFYLRIPPAQTKIYADLLNSTCGSLISLGLLHVALELPIGSDSKSAAINIDYLENIFTEPQLIYVEPFLSNIVVQSIVPFRENNVFYNDLWNKEHIRRIEIVMEHTDGFEVQGDFATHPGVIRQLLAGPLTSILLRLLIEVNIDTFGFPVQYTTADLIQRKLDCLVPYTHIFKKWDQTASALFSSDLLTGQYAGLADAFLIKNTSIVNKPSFAAVLLTCTDLDWYGVPMLLVAGKKMKADSSYARVIFRKDKNVKSARENFRFSTKQSHKPSTLPLAKQNLPDELVFVFEESNRHEFTMGPGIYCTKDLHCLANGTFLEKNFKNRSLLTFKQQNSNGRAVFTKFLQPTTNTNHITNLMHNLIEGYLSPVPDSGLTNLGYMNKRIMRTWNKPGPVPDPLTSIAKKYILLAWRLWSLVATHAETSRLPVVYTAGITTTIDFNFPAGHNSIAPPVRPFVVKDYKIPVLPPISSLRWSQMPNVLMSHPEDTWQKTLINLAHEILVDCINVNIKDGRVCNIAMVGGTSLFGINNALEKKYDELETKPIFDMWPVQEFCNQSSTRKVLPTFKLMHFDKKAKITHRLLGDDVDCHRSCEAFATKYRNLIRGENRMDWVLLGVGPNGEVGGLSEETVYKTDDPLRSILCPTTMPPLPEHPGMTMSFTGISKARHRVVVVATSANPIPKRKSKANLLKYTIFPLAIDTLPTNTSLKSWILSTPEWPAIKHLLKAPIKHTYIIYQKKMLKQL